jgi:hypothetical protein
MIPDEPAGRCQPDRRWPADLGAESCTLIGMPALPTPREWLASRDGRIRPVVSVPDGDGSLELLTPEAWETRLLRARQRTCSCGQPSLGSGRTCGAAECIARLNSENRSRRTVR